ncbi:MAG: DNA repair exonuclease [Clostridia bacterium]|nr:DNA repair exonuclease [Clostridia bacterium]
MKILHTSDLHLASSLTSRLTGERLKTRRAELSLVFERTVEEAVYRGASLIIIAGDLFDTERITARQREHILESIARCPMLDFLYLPGNHEREALTAGVGKLPENLKLFGSEWTYYDYGLVRIAGRSTLSADMFDTLQKDPEKKNIAVLHGGVSDRSSESAVGLKDAAASGIDYVALGHYHSYEHIRLEGGGSAVYSGTPEGRGFDEAGPCGVVLIETDGVGLSHSFIPTAKREIVIKNVDISAAHTRLDIDDAVRETLLGVEDTSLVRVVLTGRHSPELAVDTDTLNRRYAEKFFYFEALDESGIVINPEDYRYDKSLKGEFIRLVMSKEMDEAERERIIKTGLGALVGDLTDI